MRKNFMYRLSLIGTLFFGTLVAPNSVLTSNVMAQDDDDMYFTSSKKTAKTNAPVRTQSKSVTTIISDRAPKIEVYNSNARSDDEYNRRYSYDNVPVQEEEVDTVYDINDEENDYLYSRRILRFHSPTRIIVSSPYYWDLVYVNGIYDYLYDPFYYDPFYWNWGWGYGCTWGPWSCWYGPIWGYASPWRPWGAGWGPVYGPVWVGPHFYGPGGNLRYSNSLNRGTFRTANRYGSASSAVRTNALAGTNGTSRGSLGRASSNSRGLSAQSRTNILERGNSINQERNSYTRPSSSRYSTNDGRTVTTNQNSRVTVNRNDVNSNQVRRTTTNSNTNSSRTTTNRYSTQSTQSTQSRTNTSTYTPSRSSSSSVSSGSMSRGSMGGGASMSRGSSGISGGGASRGGGRR